MSLDVLHISNNYISSTVHRDLVAALDECDPALMQHVFVPIRDESHRGMHAASLARVRYTFRYCIPRWLRFFPLLKVLIVFLALSRERDALRRSDVIVAHSLWQDGVVAFLLSWLRCKPYVVFVRNTDANLYLPRLLHYRWLMRRVVQRAHRVLFVTQNYRSVMLARYQSVFAGVDSGVLSNGIDPYWIRHVRTHDVVVAARREVLFVGRFDANKNLPAVLAAVALARQEVPDLTLRLVGGTRAELLPLTGNTAIPEWVNIDGKISDKDKLASLYASALVLLVPSFHETFGLVYLEALSQGCACIFSRGEGVDGLFPPSPVFSAVDPRDTAGIASAITRLVDYPGYVADVMPLTSAVAGGFSWQSRAQALHAILVGAVDDTEP